MKRLMLTTLFIVFSLGAATAQECDSVDFDIEKNEVNITEEEVFNQVEEMPTFRGGSLVDFCSWVGATLKYPVEAMEQGIQGNVIIQFVVCADGKMRDFKVLRSPDELLSNAALEALQKANELADGWKPGKQRGKSVNVSFTIPIKFALQLPNRK